MLPNMNTAFLVQCPFCDVLVRAGANVIQSLAIPAAGPDVPMGIAKASVVAFDTVKADHHPECISLPANVNSDEHKRYIEFVMTQNLNGKAIRHTGGPV